MRARWKWIVVLRYMLMLMYGIVPIELSHVLIDFMVVLTQLSDLVGQNMSCATLLWILKFQTNMWLLVCALRWENCLMLRLLVRHRLILCLILVLVAWVLNSIVINFLRLLELLRIIISFNYMWRIRFHMILSLLLALTIILGLCTWRL